MTASQSPEQHDDQFPSDTGSGNNEAPLAHDTGPIWEVDSAPPRAESVRGYRFDLKLFLLLLGSAFVATLLTLPYSWTLLKQAKSLNLPEILIPVALALGVFIEVMISAVMICLGLALGPYVGLGEMVVPALPPFPAAGRRRLWVSFGEPLALGLTMGIIVAGFARALNPNLPARAQPLVMPSAWEGLLASFGAGIREEIWLRLGVMTLCAWVGATLLRQVRPVKSELPSTVYGVANVLAALLFAAVHIPQAQALLGLTGPLVIFILLGNGLPALGFGWLYWRRGLVTAMLAHFGFDLVLKVFVPLVS